jgi:hypothetical protein
MGSSIGWVIPTAWGWTQHQVAAKVIGSASGNFLLGAALQSMQVALHAQGAENKS